MLSNKLTETSKALMFLYVPRTLTFKSSTTIHLPEKALSKVPKQWLHETIKVLTQ